MSARDLARLLVRLQRPGAWIEGRDDGAFLRLTPDRRRPPLQRVEAGLLARLAREPGLEPVDGGWRLVGSGSGQAASLAGRPDPGGGRRLARVRPGSALDWMAARGQLTPVERAVALRLEEAFQSAASAAPLTVCWDGLPPSPRAGSRPDPLARHEGARARLARALALLSPQDQALMRALCAEGLGLTEAERRLRLGRGQARLRLRAALARLAGHWRIG